MGDIPAPHEIDYLKKNRKEKRDERPSIYDKPPEIPADRPNSSKPEPARRHVIINYGEDEEIDTNKRHQTFDINDPIGDKPQT